MFLPDRQTIYILDYLVKSLNGDEILNQIKPNNIVKVVNKVLACEPIEGVGKGSEMLMSQGLPLLAFFPDRGDLSHNLSASRISDNCTFRLIYICRMPSNYQNYSGYSIGKSWCRTLFFQITEHLKSSNFVETGTKAGIHEVAPGKYNLITDWSAGFSILDAEIKIVHTMPPYVEAELSDLKTISVSIGLLDQDDSEIDYTMEGSVNPNE